jgi:hypothetical protein
LIRRDNFRGCAHLFASVLRTSPHISSLSLALRPDDAMRTLSLVGRALLFSFLFVLFPLAAWAQAPNAWVNEFHYDNTGGDEGEFVEVVVQNPGAFDLGDLEVRLYRDDGTRYGTIGDVASDFTEGSTSGAFTVYTWEPSSLQNGPANGMALCYNDMAIQVLSYEGTFTGSDGDCADGIESTDVGVDEDPAPPPGNSLQLIGDGAAYDGYTWTGPDTDSPGTLNAGQTLLSSPIVVDDDGTEDFTSLQAALEAAGHSYTIDVEPGTYNEDVGVDVPEVVVKGPNAGIPGDGSRSSEATIEGQVVISASDATFDGLDVSPPPATSNASAEALRISNTPDNVVVKNNIVRDFEEDGLPEWEGLDGIVAFGGSSGDAIENVTISDNKVQNLDGRDTKGGTAGISIQGNVSGATVTGNKVTDIGMQATAWAFGLAVRGTGNHGKTPSNVNVSSNSVSSILSNPATSTVGVGFGFEDGTANSTTITDNSFSSTELQVEDKTSTLDLDNVLTNNTFDRAAVVRTNPIAVPRIFSDIQSAVDSASSGQTVDVQPGTYGENVTVDASSIQVEGPNAGIPGDGSRSSEATIEGQVVISAAGVTFDGFDVSPPSATSNPTGEALRVSDTPNDVVVKNNIVRDFSETGIDEDVEGIVAFGGASTPLENVTIRHNLVEDVTRTTDGFGAVGISIQGNVSGATVTENTVRNISKQTALYGFGIVVRGSGNPGGPPSGVAVTDNEISSVLSDSGPFAGVGFGVEDGSVASVTGNNLSDTELQAEDKTFNLDLIAFIGNNTLDRAAVILDGSGGVKDENSAQRVYSSIGAPVGRASTGGTVQVYDGTYAETVTVDKALTLQDASTPTIDAFEVTADNVTIDGFKITGGTVGGETAGIFVQPNTSGHTFSGNTLSGSGDGAGLRINSGVSDTELTENNISEWALGVDADELGQNVQVTDNCITGNATAGVESSGGQILTATGNYWGASSGPSGDYPGTGDAVLGNVTVDFSPEPVAACPSGDPTPDCEATTLSESVTPPEDGDPGVVTATFTNTDGIEEIEFTKLDNFTVTGEPDGFTRSGDTWTADDLQDPPTTAVFDLTQTTVGDPSTYFAIASSTCPTKDDGQLEVNFDPVHELPPKAPTALQFAGNAPNPFGERTTIEFALPEQTDVTLAVYDMMGRRVATLVDGPTRAGTHQIPWNGRTRNGQALASGVYLLRLTADEQAFTRRMTLVR